MNRPQTTVADLIAWLQTKDQEALVEVVVCRYQPATEEWGNEEVPLDLNPESNTHTYVNYRRSPWLSPGDYAYKRGRLILGDIG